MVTQIIEDVHVDETHQEVHSPEKENQNENQVPENIHVEEEIVFLGSELTPEWYESMKNTFEKRIAANKKLPNIIILYPWESIPSNMVKDLYERQTMLNQSVDYARVPFYRPELTE